MTIVIEQIVAGLIAGLITAGSIVYKYMQSKVNNISPDEMDEILEEVLDAVKDNEVTREELIEIVKSLLSYTKD